MIEPRRYEVVQAECPLCGKTLEGMSEKHWLRNLQIHLQVAQNHMLPQKEAERIIKTAKPLFHTKIKTKYYMSNKTKRTE